MRRFALIFMAFAIALAPAIATADPGDDDGWLDGEETQPDNPPPPEDTPPPNDGTDPPPDTTPPEEDPATTVTVRVQSTPSGAAVFRYGEPLGVTPVELTFDRDTLVEDWELFADGYEPFTLQVDLNVGGDFTAALVPEGGTTPPNDTLSGGETTPPDGNPPNDGDGAGDGGNATGPDTVTAQKAIDPAASKLYDEALEALLKQRYRAAERLFKHFTERFPDDPRLFTAQELERISGHFAIVSENRTIQKEIADDDSGFGAIEFVTTSTLFGIWSGIAWSFAADLDESAILVTSLTGLAGLGFSLWYAFNDTINDAESALITNGIALGTWNAVAIHLATDVDLATCSDSDFSFNCTEYAPLVYWLSGAIGLGVAAVVGASFDITPGQVALANSGAIWGTFTAGMMLLIVNGYDSLSERALFGTLLAGTNLGFAGMAIASPWLPTTRGRQALIDLGGLLGGLLSLGIVTLSDLTDDSPRATGAIMLLGAGGGIALTAWLTNGMVPDSPRDDDEAAEDEDTTTFLPPTPFLFGQQDARGRSGFAAGLNVVNVVF